jgi:hypothetical protein
MGRPLLTPELRRDSVAQAYLTQQEFRIVSRAAMKQDKHLSEYMREIILREAEKKEAL